MSAATVVVRPAAPADADGLAAVHVRTWRSAYAGLLPQATLDRLDVDARARRWRRILSRERRAETWVAVLDGKVLGFSSAGVARDVDPPTPLELYALYLDPDRHGSGIADALIEAAVDEEPAYLWVLDGNARAIRFYERQGFDLDGARKTETAADGTLLHELRMVRL